MALNNSSTVKEAVVLTHELIAYLEAMDSEADVYGAIKTADGNYVLMEPIGIVVSEEDGCVYIGFQGTSVPDDVALALDGVEDEDEDEE